MDFDCLLLSNC